MKKQLLILALAVIAVGFTSSVYAQLVPQPLQCIDLNDPLNVVPGQPYTYEVDVPTPPGAKTFHWFITQDVNMITAGAITATPQLVGGPILAAGDAHYNVATPNANTINLTFQSFTLAANQYVFLGILVENTDAGLGCTTNNFKVYRIQPMHAFSLDIANVDGAGAIQAGYGTDNFTSCMADISAASYDAVNDAMIYDFN
ncbi:MAG: hypothetical protein IPF68_05140, partial [Bacteroidales bacterium]|nr:hypothetical protein [Bacteroidales bacterium]